jgi:hypothetical protein
VACFDTFDYFASKSLYGISLNKSQFLRDEHARLEQETAAQRWVEELTHELEAARLSELYEHDRAARSALSSE